MKTLTIRGIPEEVHRALKERARRNRRSLNQEVIAELAATSRSGYSQEPQEAAQKRERAEAMVQLVEKWRSRIPGTMTAEEIDAAIDEGRK